MIDREFCEKVSSASLGGYDVKYNTWELCERAIREGIQGDFVEAGTYKGAHPMIMAKVASLFDPTRHIHLYDSFDGVPKVTSECDEVEAKAYGKSDKLESSGVAYATVEHTKNAFLANRAPLDNCIFHKGWFQDVLPNEEIPIIAVLRLDVDLMESNDICMEYFYPKLVKGGFFITDDWGKAEDSPWKQVFYDKIKELGFKKPRPATIKNEPGTAWWQKT